MRRLTTLLLLIALAFAAQGEVYRHVLPDGSVEFSDDPASGGDTVLLPPLPVYQAPPPPSPSSPAPVQPSSESQPRPAYKISITRPHSDETFVWSDQGVAVEVSLSPVLAPGDGIAIFLDGTRVAKGSGPSFSLKELFRGSHQLTAAVEDASGKVMARAPAITFHVFQNSQGNKGR